MQRRLDNPTRSTRSRRAVIAFEFLLAIPIALGLVFAIAEFGILLASVKFVEMAAMEGAREAAKLERPHMRHAARVAKYKTDRVLATAGLKPSCAVVIRHNVRGVSRSHLYYGQCKCGPGPGYLPSHHRVAAVECTVTVPMSHLTPNLLAYLGFSTSGRRVSASHTVPYLRDDGRRDE